MDQKALEAKRGKKVTVVQKESKVTEVWSKSIKRINIKWGDFSMLIITGQTFSSIISIIGVIGSQGPKGGNGPTGEKGERGPRGEK